MTAIRNCLVVGGTSGIGEALALQISANFPSSRVIIAGRNKVKGDAICQSSINKNMVFESLDASRIKNVKQFCYGTAVKDKVDLLIMSQGMLSFQGRSVVDEDEDLDRKMALYYYSRMGLIKFLSDSNKLSDNAIIVTIFYGNHSNANSSSIDFTDISLRKGYSPYRCTQQCMHLTDIMMDHYASKPNNRDRTFIHAFPGFVRTNTEDNSPHLPLGVATLTKIAGRLFATSPEKCAKVLLNGPGGGQGGEKGGILFNAEGGGGAKKAERVGRYNLYSDGSTLLTAPIKSKENEKLVLDHTFELFERC